MPAVLGLLLLSGCRGGVNEAYIIFGQSGTSRADVDLSSLSSSDGILITPDATGQYMGSKQDSIGSAGDVNGDGFADVALGDFRVNNGGSAVDGSAWVVYGNASPGNVDLNSFSTAQAVEFTGTGAYQVGRAAFGPGDVNGDGIDDLFIGNFNGPGGNVGAAYIVYGQSGGFGTTAIGVSTLNGGATGFRIDGETANDRFGISAGRGGDVNGDGVNDFLAGGSSIDANGGAYIIYGVSGTRSNLDLAGGIGAGDGFKISPTASTWGFTLQGGGQDFDGDGVPEFAIGASQYGGSAGRVAVLEGDAGTLTLGTPAAGQGFLLNGSATGRLGGSFSLSGDVNGDGLSDLLVGETFANNNGAGNSGSVYLIFGQAGIPASGALASTYADGVSGIRIDGVAGERIGKSTDVSDVNGDSCADLIMGGSGNQITIIYGGVAQ